MNATELIFPRPGSVRMTSGKLTLPSAYSLTGADVPPWLRSRLKEGLRSAGSRLHRSARRGIKLELNPGGFPTIRDESSRGESYRLTIDKDASIRIQSPGLRGLQHGIVTLSLLLEAAAAGSKLTPLQILDSPAFRARGLMVDLARGFFPSLPRLKRIVDRMVDLKLNTLFLYLENHFQAPGLEDLSPKGSLTPQQAKELTAYGKERGIDVAPAGNFLTHMEGILRLERHADLADGPHRSHLVLTRLETKRLVRQYIDAFCEAFTSPNFFPCFDEYLFAGTNPEAARMRDPKTKALAYANFVRDVILYLQKKGKTVWIADDMLVGRNVYRKEGFGNAYRAALARIPKETVLFHWWYDPPPYQDPEIHEKILRRVAAARRPLAMAPSSRTYRTDGGYLDYAARNQCDMARCGLRLGAFAYINTQWEGQKGNSFESSWPLTAMAAGPAWQGGGDLDSRDLRAAGFVLTGETDGSLFGLARTLTSIADIINASGQHGTGAIRLTLFEGGPFALWRKLSPSVSPAHRKRMRKLLGRAKVHYAGIGSRDPELRKAMALPLVLLEAGLDIMDYFDQAWAEYHRAAEIERNPHRHSEFDQRITNAILGLRNAGTAVVRYRNELKKHERFGHTPYDCHVLDRHRTNLARVERLLRAVVREDRGLPYFEKLFFLPDEYRSSNLMGLRWVNDFHNPVENAPWPIRWSKPSTK